MRSSKSCGGSAVAQGNQARSSLCARCRAADGSVGAASSTRHHGLRAAAAACDSHSKSSSAALKMGLRNARANDRSWPGETSTSSSATKSSASGDSCSSSGSATTCGTFKRASACATAASTMRRRDSTMISPGASRCSTISAATAAATCAASSASRRVSGSVRGSVSESRQVSGSGRTPAVPLGVRATPGRQRSCPAAADEVVWARYGAQPSSRAASSNTALIAATTAGALRRVWSHCSSTPSRPCTTKSRAAPKTWGSAPRKR